MSATWLPPTLHTDRLTLRPITVDDVDELFRWQSDLRLFEYMADVPHTSRADTERYYEQFVRGWYGHKAHGPFAVTWKSRPGQLVGDCGLYPNGTRAFSLGFWVAADSWGQGVATEAVGRLVAHGFDRFAHVERVQAQVFVGNAASERVLAKCGFTLEGTHPRSWPKGDRLFDVRTYARLRGDPVPDTAARPPTLRTARLVLRPIVGGDADAIFAACSDPVVTAHLLFPSHTSLADTRRFLSEVVAPSYAAGLPGPWAVCLAESPDRLVGCVGARPDPSAPHRMEVGYWLAREVWGSGLAAEAVVAVTAHVFATRSEVVRVFGRVFDGNTGSRRVLEKAGFQYEGLLRKAELVKGELRDDHYYSRLRDDPPVG